MTATTLSLPARAVVIVPGHTIDQAIAAERERRVAMMVDGHPYHYWRERGDDEKPSEDHWCPYCTGFYGVPHDKYTHRPRELCRSIGHAPDCRQCACLDCVVYEAWRAAQ